MRVFSLLSSPSSLMYIQILIGDSSGRLTLWNIRSRKLVHEFTLDDDSNETGGEDVAITAVEGSPAIDVVAVGSADGRIQLVNLRYDRVLFSLRQDRVRVTSLTFRTDTGSEETPMIVSGGQDGQVRWSKGQDGIHHGGG